MNPTWECKFGRLGHQVQLINPPDAPPPLVQLVLYQDCYPASNLALQWVDAVTALWVLRPGPQLLKLLRVNEYLLINGLLLAAAGLLVALPNTFGVGHPPSRLSSPEWLWVSATRDTGLQEGLLHQARAIVSHTAASNSQVVGTCLNRRHELVTCLLPCQVDVYTPIIQFKDAAN